jgi:hypothetical protein
LILETVQPDRFNRGTVERLAGRGASQEHFFGVGGRHLRQLESRADMADSLPQVGAHRPHSRLPHRVGYFACHRTASRSLPCHSTTSTAAVSSRQQCANRRRPPDAVANVASHLST